MQYGQLDADHSLSVVIGSDAPGSSTEVPLHVALDTGNVTINGDVTVANEVAVTSALPAGTNLIGAVHVTSTTDEYETVAASQTDQVLGATGAAGDVLEGLLIVPAAAAAGAVSIKDGSTSISIFAGGGTTALSDLKPFYVKLGLTSVNGAWKVTTGASVSVIGIGNFT